MISVISAAARMATSANPALEKNAERRSRVLLGPLPSEFLQANGGASVSAEQREAADRQAALALQQQLCGAPASALPAVPPGLTGRLSITIAQAKLVKNYGMTRMDPYVRLRVGHCIYETHTDPNGGKTPRWNKVIHCLLPPGVTSIYLEIFDECSFTMDELVAWTQIIIPPQVVKGETHEDWYPLNGKQGEGVEGMINLVLSYSLAPTPAVAAYPAGVMMMPASQLGYTPVSMYPTYPAQPAVAHPSAAHPAAAHPPVPQPLSEEELKQIQEMFPSIDKEVIKSVSEANLGNKDGTINSLLQMSE